MNANTYRLLLYVCHQFTQLLSLLAIVASAALLVPELSVAMETPCASSTGRYIAFKKELTEPSEGRKKYLVVWELTSCSEILRIPVKSIDDCAIDETKRLIAVGGYIDNETCVQVWSLDTKELLWKSESDQRVRVRFTQDGKHLVVGSTKRGRNVEIMRSVDGSKPTLIAASYQTNGFIQLSPDDSRVYLYQSARDQRQKPVKQDRIACFSLDDGKLVGQIPISSNRYPRFAVSENYLVEQVFFKDAGQGLIIYDAINFSELRRIHVPGGQSYSFPYIGEESQSVFCATRGSSSKDFCDGMVLEYDISSGEQKGIHKIHMGTIAGGLTNVTMIPRTRALAWQNDSGVCFVGGYERPSSSGFSLTLLTLPGARNSIVTLPNEARGIMSRTIIDNRGQPGHFYRKERAENRNSGQWETWRYEQIRSAQEFKQDPQAVMKIANDLFKKYEKSGESPIDRSKPRLFLLSVGVSKHEFEEYNLNHAARDAIAVKDRFAEQKSRLFGDVQYKLLTDANATPSKIRDELKWLSRSSTENDQVMLFFAGHGMKGSRGLYFFTHIGDEENIFNTCVNWSEVAAALSATRAKSIFVLTDCCHAGAFSAERYLNQSEIAEELDKTPNLSIFASSSRNEFSFENDTIQQGVFTHAILNALDSAADMDKDGQISWDELVTHVKREVPKLTSGKQNPELVKDSRAISGFPLAAVNEVPSEAASRSPLNTTHILIEESALASGKDVIAMLPQGTKVQASEEQGSWRKVAVELDGRIKSGWVRSSSLKSYASTTAEFSNVK